MHVQDASMHVTDVNMYVTDANIHATDVNMHVTDVNMHVHICNMHVTDVNSAGLQSDVRGRAGSCLGLPDTRRGIICLRSTIKSNCHKV